MKPKELLGLIEEVSGTRMYELKRANAVKLVGKKEQKLIEIQNLLSEEIQPNVERLQKEKADYQNYVTLKEALYHFQKFDVAYRYYWSAHCHGCHHESLPCSLYEPLKRIITEAHHPRYAYSCGAAGRVNTG